MRLAYCPLAGNVHRGPIRKIVGQSVWVLGWLYVSKVSTRGCQSALTELPPLLFLSALSLMAALTSVICHCWCIPLLVPDYARHTLSHHQLLSILAFLSNWLSQELISHVSHIVSFTPSPICMGFILVGQLHLQYGKHGPSTNQRHCQIRVVYRREIHLK